MHFAYTAPAVVPAEVAIEFGRDRPVRDPDRRGARDAAGHRAGGAAAGGRQPATGRWCWRSRSSRSARISTRATARSYRWPLVEAAACLWLERGRGRALRSSRRATAGGRPAPRAAGRALRGGPARGPARWRARATAGPVELSGRWRGEQARLHWSPERSHARGSAA